MGNNFLTSGQWEEIIYISFALGLLRRRHNSAFLRTPVSVPADWHPLRIWPKVVFLEEGGCTLFLKTELNPFTWVLVALLSSTAPPPPCYCSLLCSLPSGAISFIGLALESLFAASAECAVGVRTEPGGGEGV